MAGIEVTAVGPGTELRDGRYELVRLLGSGGMATVWEATDTKLGRTVAVKVLSDALAHDDEYLARFRREAKLAAGLNHPGLVNVFDVQAETERPYLVMEHVTGGTLADRLKQAEPLDTDALASDLLDALGYIHRAGIVHRDVKPANVLLRDDSRACLTDFGVASLQDATRITQTGQIPGTKSYMAPELLEGEPASELTDLYSCGVLLREAAGQAGGSARLIALADELAAPDPAQRPATAEVAAERLEARPAPDPPGAPTELWPSAGAELGADGGGDKGDGPRRPSPSPYLLRSTPRASRRRGWMAAAAVASVGAFIALVVGVSGGDKAPQSGGKQQATADPADEAPATGEAATESDAPTEGDAATPTASGDDPALGARLNDRGFALINGGDPEAAVPVLERAVSAFPAGTDDDNYAFALYNLGHALRLAGEPERAIPVLEERLKIPNQTDVVAAELEQAKADAGE